MNSIVELQIVGVIGLVGNGLSMLIFYRQRVHKIFHNLLLTLAIFDTVCIRIETIYIQGGPSASGKIYVDIKFKVPSLA